MSPNAPMAVLLLESTPASPTLSDFNPVQQPATMSRSSTATELPPCNCPQCVPGQAQFYYPQGFFQAAIPPQPALELEPQQGFYAPDGCWYPFPQQPLPQSAFFSTSAPPPVVVSSAPDQPSSPISVDSSVSSASPTTPQFSPIEQQQAGPLQFGSSPPPPPTNFEPFYGPFPVMMGMPMLPFMGPPPMQLSFFMPMQEVEEKEMIMAEPTGIPLAATTPPPALVAVKQSLFFGEIPAASMPVMMNA